MENPEVAPEIEIYIKLSDDEWQFGTKTNGVTNAFEDAKANIAECLYCFIEALEGGARPNLKLVKGGCDGRPCKV